VLLLRQVRDLPPQLQVNDLDAHVAQVADLPKTFQEGSFMREVLEVRVFDSRGYRRFATARRSAGGKLDD
jgi:hypothetical protein